MIEGVQKLPWLATLDRLKHGHGYDCDTCTIAKDQRKHYKCGWIPREQWESVHGSAWGVVGGSHSIPETCPGYTVRLPIVQEVARLWGWEKRGCLDAQLRGRSANPGPLELDLLDIFSAESARAESWELDQRRKR